MSKLSDYLEQEKIDSRRLLAASKRAETPTAEDLAVLAARKKLKGGDESDPVKELAAKPCRAGRPLTQPTLNRALKGRDLPRKARARVVRAINAVLTQRKKAEVAAADLF